jgi:hypothetical protein
MINRDRKKSMSEFTDNELWILRAAIETFVQYQKDMGIHPERIEETKALMRKLWDITQKTDQ